MKAVIDTNQFLKALYLDENPSEALKFCDQQLRVSVGADDLNKMISQTKREQGHLTELAADSYLMAQGQSMELFYVGRYENGTLYHRLVVIGDATSGYKVLGVWFQQQPYPPSQLRRNFEMQIVVQ